MSEQLKLPLLPGFTVHRPKQNNCLPHCFQRLAGTNLIVEKNFADNDWIFKDKKILCFNANYREKCDDCQKDKIRPVKILYFTEDGTIKVIEVPIDDSTKPVCVVQRQLIPCELRDRNECLTYMDLNVQKQVKIFDQIYDITDCDNFTRFCLNKAGIEVPKSNETQNHHLDPRCEQVEEYNVQKPNQPEARPMDVTKHHHFLEFDNLRLKFDAYWDDRDSPFGEVHNLTVYYYLQDDTFEIFEHPKDERSTKFYKRLKLPKQTGDVFSVYQKKNPMVLGTTTLDKSVIDRSDNSNSCNVDYYKDCDLKIGQEINVFGRKVMLTNCDDFTRDFYRKQYGIEEFIPMETPKDPEWSPIDTEKSLPPYNGWGSHEDSETNCLSFPKPCKLNGKTILQQDNSKLRFKAKMIPKTSDDVDREFVITFHLDDDTISVFEVESRFNPSGEFLKRAKFCLPHQLIFINRRPEIFSSNMFYIGATIDLNRFLFRIIDADEFTLNYMESHASEYPMANIDKIMCKVRGAIKPIYKDFFCKYLGKVPKIEMSSNTETIKLCNNTTALALRDLLGNEITNHEIVTFLRYFNAEKSAKGADAFDRTMIQSLVQTALANRFWNNIQELEELIYGKAKGNYLDPDKLYCILKGCRIPIKSKLLDQMFTVLKKDENGNIDVRDFLHFIDCKRSKAPPIQPINPYNGDNKKPFDCSARPKLIDWSAIVLKLDLQTE